MKCETLGWSDLCDSKKHCTREATKGIMAISETERHGGPNFFCATCDYCAKKIQTHQGPYKEITLDEIDVMKILNA